MKLLVPLALLASLLLVSATLPTPTPTPITGNYLEARTASVFAGACHYNGELVTTGQDALLAWNVTSGSWNGTDLAGLRALAAVSSTQNLADAHAPRKSELVIDTAASSAQAAAFAAALQSRFPQTLGTVISIRRAPITFSHDAAGYQITALNFAALSAQPMPNGECCKEPNLVWYSPLIPLQNRKVGYTTNAAYTASTLTTPWQRAAENSAFYGHFSF